MTQPFVDLSRGAWWALGAAAVLVTLAVYYIGLADAKRDAEDSRHETQKMLVAAQASLAETKRLLAARNDELQTLRIQLGNLQKTASDLHKNEFAELNRRISGYETALADRDQSLREAVAEADQLKAALSRAEAEIQRVARLRPTPQRIEGPTESNSSTTPRAPAAPVNLASMIGRWVGVADCARGKYPTSFAITRATTAELTLTYSDSLNGTDTAATLILVSDGPADPEFVFRTRDDRFIILKNGSRLLLSSDTRLASPTNASNQCSLTLRRS